MYLQFAPKINDFYEVELLSFWTWKYTKLGIFNMESFSGAIFWKTLLPLNNQRAANKILVFILTESILSLKIGRWEPLSTSVWKIVVEIAFRNGAF